VFVVTAVSAGFHEFGHAAAARYGGATPGAMGTGLYLVWPAFYTDVTDSYRLGRAGRVRTDLGGLYFNAVFALVTFGAWAASHFDALLLIIAVQVLQMVRQLAPFVRFDGYHILADLTGVPDLYSHIGPTLKGLLPNHWRDEQSRVLKPWARAVVATWCLLVVPILVLSLAMMVWALPRVAATAWASLGRQWGSLETALSDGDPVAICLRILSILAIALPVLASVYLLVRLVRQVSRKVWRWTDGRPVRRVVSAVVALALVAGLAFAWWPRDNAYLPIQPTERGSVLDAFPVQHSVPVRLQEGQVTAARTLWADPGPPPTKDEPRIAIVLVPSDPGSDAPTWVFPFNKPKAPGVGDNQALAVNTKDGSTVYDVAFALVWADGNSVLNKNEAYALASCRKCKTVAVGFQVVLVLGQADVIIPQNLSAAVNYNCRACVTYALAQQLVITLPGNLSADAMARLEDVWRRIEEFGRGIRSVPLSRIQAELQTFEREILQIIVADRPAAGGTTTSDPAEQPAGDVPAGEATVPAPTSEPTTSSDPATTPEGTTGPGEPTSSSTGQPSGEPTSTTGSSTPSPSETGTPSASATP
jgi:putative peptide zinc metalloprotease protein